MYGFRSVLVLMTTLFLCILSQYTTKWRTFYITPTSEDSNSYVDCPVNHCYSLQDIINNQSYFFDSNTTLELIPGRYDITEKVGQLVIAKVNNFTLKGSSLINDSTIITCQPNASLGFTFIQSHNVEISSIQINHCCADLGVNSSLPSKIIKNYNKHLDKHLRVLLETLDSCDSETNDHAILCCNSLASIDNKEIVVHQTAVLHSKGVGVLGLGNSGLDISKSLVAFSQINCIILVSDFAQSSVNHFSLSESHIMFGQVKYYLSLASGLNLFVYLREHKVDIHLTNVTLMNNKGRYGNFYLPLYIHSESFNTLIDVNILIRNITSVQTEVAMPGIVVKYSIQIEAADENTYNFNHFLPFPSYNTYCCPQSTWQNFGGSTDFPFSYCCQQPSWQNFGSFPLSFPSSSIYCSPWSTLPTNPFPKHRRIYIALQDNSFIGSCMTIKDSDVSIESGTFIFEISGMKIDESMCRMALTMVDSDTKYLQLIDLTITNSYNDIFSVNIGSETIELTGNTSFLANQGSISVLSGKIIFRDAVYFSNNTAHKYESIFLISDSSKVSFQGETNFINNRGRQGGAISAYESRLYFNGSVNFISNTADNGGAISLKDGSVIDLEIDTQVLFKANIAKTYGGAIYVGDAGFWVRKNGLIKCFIHLTKDFGNYNIDFENNIAEVAGMAMFGGWIDICKTNNNIRPFKFFNFKGESSIPYYSSNPSRVCICTNSMPNTLKTEIYIEAIPRQTYEIEVVAVGQRFGVVPAAVRVETDLNVIDYLQQLQKTEKKCTPLKFTIHSSNKKETMLLRVDRQDTPQQIPNGTVLAELLQLRVFITLNDCPLGFEFDYKQNICSCHHLLLNKCSLTSYTINRNAQQWISTSLTKEIVIHQHCPFDYCKPHDISLNLSTPDEQCAFSRSGILCGACQPGLSQVLGTSNCKKCSNIWLLLISVFALAGVALVACLIVLNLTVSKGTISGLIFYANIVRANTATFFPGQTANTFLGWFIAWLNLDLGIETCFYDGLNAYAKTWMQFGFPLYIWLMAIIIIFSSNYSKRAAEICGKKAVQVLATLFFLSYAKLLRVTITVFQPTLLLHGHNNLRVWHYDGNIVYLGKLHIPLLLVALLFFVLFFIPYTLILFGIQWLQIFSHYKLFNWVNKLKPLFDAYTGPYKDKHRYWTGLLLLVRIGLFIVFSTNNTGDPAINLFAIVMIIICLFAYLALFGGVYKILVLNLLEYTFLLNLVMSSASILYTMSINKPMHVHVVSTVSVSVTMFVTILIIAYHSFIAVVEKLNLRTRVSAMYKKKADSDPENTNIQYAVTFTSDPPVTHSVVELKEPLLEI